MWTFWKFVSIDQFKNRTLKSLSDRGSCGLLVKNYKLRRNFCEVEKCSYWTKYKINWRVWVHDFWSYYPPYMETLCEKWKSVFAGYIIYEIQSRFTSSAHTKVKLFTIFTCSTAIALCFAVFPELIFWKLQPSRFRGSDNKKVIKMRFVIMMSFK